MKKQIDAPIAQLVLDLEERGLLNRTLIVLASEFSRDAADRRQAGSQGEGPGGSARTRSTEPKHYGMHRHFTDAGCVLLFGGGMQARPPARRDRRRAAVQDAAGPRRHRGSARHDLSRAGHLAEARLRDREASVLRHPRRQGESDQGITFVGAVGASSTGATGALLRLQRRSSVAMDRRQAPQVTVNSSKIVVGHPRVRAPRHDRLGSRRAVAEARDERVFGP